MTYILDFSLISKLSRELYSEEVAMLNFEEFKFLNCQS